ncbi:MAG: trehalose-6-phosphate synthase [Deltaproteobacteria bacterium]|nr:trehalose-6-phosphate synthase [Deltaproteobacteria bacterium]
MKLPSRFQYVTESILKPLTARLRSVKETITETTEPRPVHDLWTAERLKAFAAAHFQNRRLIVVSNREPYTHTKERGARRVSTPPSGLVTALDPILRATSGLWVAHGSGNADRETADAEGKLMVPPEHHCYTLKRVWLTKEEEAGYYYGFSNETLWPLCHLTHNRPFFLERDWLAYQQVNRKFADAIVAECGEDRPLVLVQDYHFTLLPQMIREQRPDAVIGLFWHIPWPTVEIFQICPWKEAILLGMLGADFLGFHLQSYANNFLTTVNQMLPVRIDWDRSATLHEHGTTLAKPFPISIQPWSERGVPSETELQERALAYRKELELGEERLVVSVDRLDYTKGIPERLQAIDRFLEKYPHYVGKVRFIQLGAPSRIHIPRYRDLVMQIERLTDEVNWKHGTADWKPVLLLKAQHDPMAVYGFLHMADVCIVSPLHDGMNLVAKEYVAARESNEGALILSAFTGVAREFQEALLINPYDSQGFAEAIRQALEMPPEEQQRRLARMKAHVAEYNVYRWAADLLNEIARAAEAIHQAPAAATS